MQCIVVKSGEFENSYSLLYILLKSCLCCCSLATLAPQQLAELVHFFLTTHLLYVFMFSLGGSTEPPELPEPPLDPPQAYFLNETVFVLYSCSLALNESYI